MKIPAPEALQRLKDGNQRYVAETRTEEGQMSQARRTELVAGQEPYAIILGCSDSRAPAEILFDAGLGELFVIRVAGNIVAPSQVGSIEYAVEHLGTRLVVVLGHSNCGAVKATLQELEQPSEGGAGNVGSIVKRIRPAIEPLCDSDCTLPPEELLQKAVRANIQASVDHLRKASPLLEPLIRNDGLMVVGAEYALETGLVDFFYK